MPSDDDLERGIGEPVKPARLQRPMTLTALGGEPGPTGRQIQDYETGRSRASAGMLAGIAETLGLAPSFFFPQDGSQTPEREEASSAIVGDLRSALGRIGNAEVRDRLADHLRAIPNRKPSKPAMRRAVSPQPPAAGRTRATTQGDELGRDRLAPSGEPDG